MLEVFKINNELGIVCEAKKTKKGFKHEATLIKNGKEVDRATINYFNSTAERFRFQSVIERLIDKTGAITEKEKTALRGFVANY